MSALPSQPLTLIGAGSTFPAPLYAKWAQAYLAVRGVSITYQPTGSGEGIRRFIERSVDFGATEALVTEEQVARAGGRVLFIPTVAGAIALVYSIEDVGPGLAFTGAILADIFLGKIKKWDDPRIVEINPQAAKLPADPIVVVHRSAESGTTAIWSNYLSKVSREWKEQVGEGSLLKWPVGLSAKGDQGVAELVKRTPNALGYVELAHATANRMTFGSVRNKAGRLLAPSLTTTTAAVDAVLSAIPDDYLTLITNPDASDAYPIVGFTYLLIAGDQTDPLKGLALAQFLWWAIHDGQKQAPPLLYAPLPKNLVLKLERTLRSITVNGQPALQ